jgi:hypothetical protein
MGYKITDDDSLERMEMIAIRYMALIGEAMGHGTDFVGRASVAIRLFDYIEHAVQEAFENSPIARASFMLDNIARLIEILEGDAASFRLRVNLPTQEELLHLYDGFVRFGGRHLMTKNPFADLITNV